MDNKRPETTRPLTPAEHLALALLPRSPEENAIAALDLIGRAAKIARSLGQPQVVEGVRLNGCKIVVMLDGQ